MKHHLMVASDQRTAMRMLHSHHPKAIISRTQMTITVGEEVTKIVVAEYDDLRVIDYEFATVTFDPFVATALRTQYQLRKRP